MNRDPIVFTPPSLPPVRWIGPGPVPTEREYRAALALDLAGGDLSKAAALLHLPLFRVAVDGSEAL